MVAYACVTLFLLAAIPASHGWLKPSPIQPSPQVVPRFSVVPAATTKEGQGQVQTLQVNAGSESFLDRMLGTNCYTRAVADLRRDCRAMDQEQKSRLALRLANCQLATQGGGTYPCAADEPLRKCVDRLPDRDNMMYIEFLTHTDSMCLFIQNQEFEKYTETMLNRLSEGAGYAREQLAAVGARTEALAADSAQLVDNTQDALIRLREQRELQLATTDQLRAQRAEAAQQHAALATRQSAALELGQQQLQQSKELEAAQMALAGRVAAGQAEVEQLFGAIGERAEAVMRAQGEAAAAQQVLGGQLRALADGSKGLRSAVDTVAEYQRRSDAALIKLLGRSYTLEDAVFYGGGVLAAFAAGASRATQGARLPVLALLGVSLMGERLMLDRLHLWLDIDAAGDVVLPVYLPTWLPAAAAAGPPLVLSFKWAVRRLCIGVGAAVLLYAVLTYRDYERASYKLLVEIEDRQRQHQKELVQMRVEWLAAQGAAEQHMQADRGHKGKAAETGGAWESASALPALLLTGACAMEGKTPPALEVIPEEEAFVRPAFAAAAAAKQQRASPEETLGDDRTNSGIGDGRQQAPASRSPPRGKRSLMEGESTQAAAAMRVARAGSTQGSGQLVLEEVNLDLACYFLEVSLAASVKEGRSMIPQGLRVLFSSLLLIAGSYPRAADPSNPVGRSRFPIVINTWAFTDATEQAWEALQHGSAIDAVVAGCSACERLQCDGTVGFGGSPDESGETTLDALIMNGDTMEVGAVANLRHVKDAISTARLVMERTAHSMLAGLQAAQFAQDMGLQVSNLTTQESARLHERWLAAHCQPNFRRAVRPDAARHCGPYRPDCSAAAELGTSSAAGAYPDYHAHDTIAMVAIDRNGSIAAGASTNGAIHKIPGRVGDGAVPGGGAYADSEVGACGATGDGDVHLRFLPCYQVVENMRLGMRPQAAAEAVVARIARRVAGYVGAVVAVDRTGAHGAACHGWSFAYAYREAASEGARVVHVEAV